MLPFRSVKNFSPRPPRGGRPPAVARGYPSAKISIHALREEGDVGGDPALGLFGISIHALREEGDDVGVDDVVHIARFLSTPSARRATVAVVRVCFALEISIHALREEGDHGH